jgi:hypothetical protein
VNLWINVRENTERATIERNWQWCLHKTKKNTICVGHLYKPTNTNNVNKTWPLLQTTWGKDEPNIVFMNLAYLGLGIHNSVICKKLKPQISNLVRTTHRQWHVNFLPINILFSLQFALHPDRALSTLCSSVLNENIYADASAHFLSVGSFRQ